LEQVELPACSNHERLLATVAEELNLPEEERDRAARLLQATLAAPDFQRIAQAAEVHREVPLCVQIDGELLTGSIDCLFSDKRGWWVVDYKTDRLPQGGSDELIARYRPQCLAYVRALRQALGAPSAGGEPLPSTKRVAGAMLFFLAADPPVLQEVEGCEL
jgi:ATP-dependent exoDNAse (exonuclease V) beta subunit